MVLTFLLLPLPSCPAGVCKTDSAGKPLSIMAMISDSCPECGAEHIDVQSLAFAKVGVHRTAEPNRPRGVATGR